MGHTYNFTAKAINLLEEKLGLNLHSVGWSKALNMRSNVYDKKKKVVNWTLSKWTTYKKYIVIAIECKDNP